MLSFPLLKKTPLTTVFSYPQSVAFVDNCVLLFVLFFLAVVAQRFIGFSALLVTWSIT